MAVPIYSLYSLEMRTTIVMRTLLSRANVQEMRDVATVMLEPVQKTGGAVGIGKTAIRTQTKVRQIKDAFRNLARRQRRIAETNIHTVGIELSFRSGVTGGIAVAATTGDWVLMRPGH